MNKSILITGANSGLGKDAARQFALIPETEIVYLACRNPQKAAAAKAELEQQTGRQIFEIVIMDVSKPDSVRSAVEALKEPIDALVMNAGGMGGKTPEKLTKEGVTNLFAHNLLGHVVLVEELLAASKLNNVVMYAGSEAARGIKKMGIPQPNLTNSSVEEFTSVINGAYFSKKWDPMQAYGLVKYIAALWIGAQARKNLNIRFITVSPGGTKGTNVVNDMKGFQKFMFKYIMMPFLMPAMKLAHNLEDGAKRYVDAVNDPAYKTGIFYGSEANVLVGPMIDQSTLFPELKNTKTQDNAARAIQQFVKALV